MEATLHDMQTKIVDFIQIIKSKNVERDELKKQLDCRTEDVLSMSATLDYYNFFKYLSIYSVVFSLLLIFLLLLALWHLLYDHKSLEVYDQ